MAMVHLTIDGVPVSVEEGTTVLKAAHAAGIKIPTLCWLKDINEIGACRMCVVDVGARSLAAACVMPVSEGMVVKTNTPQVRQARRAVLELILSNHERKCLSCVRSQNCELQDLAKELGVDEDPMGILDALFTPVDQDQLGGEALRFLGLLPPLPKSAKDTSSDGEPAADPGLETVKN